MTHCTQLVLEDAPVAALERPAGHALQYEWPENSLYLPGWHAWQEEAFPALNVPGPHTVNVRVSSPATHMAPSGQGAQEAHVGVSSAGGRK